ncbi:ArpT protein [Enterococcus faecium]|uniref:ArpT protein n=1 Tax=Enterococcus faecium TaxID=1352 RepID=A0ABD7LQ20_ENTFC|nr:hypothetical protein [Enterococcus faecium]SAM55069.1 ArpT protein [Enterococcus faecium]
MKLKDGFYASSHGIGGLMLGVSAKKPKKPKKKKNKNGDMGLCGAEEVIYTFWGDFEESVYTS